MRAKVSWSAIAQIESGRRRNVRPDTLAALARALEVTTDYLIEAAASTPVMLTHQALIYGGEEDFVTAVGPVLAEGAEHGDPALVVASDEKIELVRELLRDDGRGVEYVRSAELYSEPAAALAAYRQFVERGLRDGAHWIRIVGEPVWAGRSAAQARCWCRYESLLNLAFASLPVTVICPYDVREVKPSILRHARATHPETIVEGVTAPSPEYVEPPAFMLVS